MVDDVQGKIKQAPLGLSSLVLSLLAVMGFMPFVPTGNEFSVLLFLFLYVCVWVVWFCSSARKNLITWRGVAWLFLLVLVFIFNFLFAMLGDVRGEGWFRSFVPMLFFLTVFVVPFYVRMIGAAKIFKYLLCASVIYCAKIIIFDYESLISLFAIGGRLSYYTLDVVVPLPFIGVMIATLLPGISFLWRLMLVALLMFFVIIVGYKTQILFLALFFLFYFSTRFGGAKRALFVVFGAGVGCGLYLGLEEYWLERFSTIGGGGDQTRMLEIKYAWSVFVQSPIFGGGLGTEVPLSETRPDFKMHSDLWESDTVTYVHNFVLYLLMTGGVLFLSLFMALLSWGRIFEVGGYFSNHACVRLASWCGLGLVFFWLTSASFKQIQAVVMLSLILGIGATLKGRDPTYASA